MKYTANNTAKNIKAFKGRSLIVAFIVIAICEAFFVLDIAADIFHLDIAAAWIDHSVIELISTVTLAFSLLIIGLQIRQLHADHRDAQAAVKVASGELLAVIDAKFESWKLSASERQVALLLIKGFSAQEIADLRDTRPGTVKSQSSAIYQKAGVKGRSELAAYFVEDLLAGEIILPTA